MSDPLSALRIVVAEPTAGEGHRDLGTLPALRRLGPQLDACRVHDAEGCLARVREDDVDLLVVDLRLGEVAQCILGQLRPGDPPAIAVVPDDREESCLTAFRGGAADCVVAGSDFAGLLAAAALEQVRRWRTTREHLRLKRNLLELRSYNENIIQNMNSALVVLDPQGCVTFANPISERVLGVPAGSLPGRSIWDWFPELSRESVPLWQTLGEGVRLQDVEVVVRRPAGERIPIGLSSAPLLDGEGGPLGAVAIFRDLSEIKQLQRQVVQREKMASIGQLAAGVAHEINNPMGFIHANLCQMTEYLDDLRRLWAGVAELRKASAAGELAEVREAAARLDALDRELDADFLLSDLLKAVRESQEGSERIRHIVQDLRAFTHQGSRRVPTDLNQCLDSTANIVWTMMKHSAVLEKDYGKLPPVACDAMQLKQVFMNLLVNAYQAIEAKARSQGVVGERGRIRLRTRRRGDGVVVEVTDTGEGIAQGHVDRIFEPFFTTKEVGEGTGLGLSTSYNIVRRHGGTLRVQSQPGSGTTFEMFLPLGAGERGA